MLGHLIARWDATPDFANAKLFRIGELFATGGPAVRASPLPGMFRATVLMDFLSVFWKQQREEGAVPDHPDQVQHVPFDAAVGRGPAEGTCGAGTGEQERGVPEQAYKSLGADGEAVHTGSPAEARQQLQQAIGRAVADSKRRKVLTRGERPAWRRVAERRHLEARSATG